MNSCNNCPYSEECQYSNYCLKEQREEGSGFF